MLPLTGTRLWSNEEFDGLFVELPILRRRVRVEENIEDDVKAFEE